MLQFQEVLSIYKIEFWCGLTIAILIWGYINGDHGGGGGGGGGGARGGKGVKILTLDRGLE